MPRPPNPYVVFCAHVQHLCTVYDVSIVSWWRTAKRDIAPEEPTNYKHRTGLAVDLIPDDLTQKETIISEASSLNLLAMDRGDHIHLESQVTPSLLRR